MKNLKSKVIAMLVIAAVIASVAFISNVFGNKYSETLEGKALTVDWTYVNVRQKPYEGSAIIGQLYLGEKVVLTGHEKNYFGGKGQAIDNWVEILLADGSTGWTVRAAYENF